MGGINRDEDYMSNEETSDSSISVEYSSNSSTS